jgi:hypothetical protein
MVQTPLRPQTRNAAFVFGMCRVLCAVSFTRFVSRLQLGEQVAVGDGRIFVGAGEATAGRKWSVLE